jgi:hypothetical protein
LFRGQTLAASKPLPNQAPGYRKLPARQLRNGSGPTAGLSRRPYGRSPLPAPSPSPRGPALRAPPEAPNGLSPSPTAWTPPHPRPFLRENRAVKWPPFRPPGRLPLPRRPFPAREGFPALTAAKPLLPARFPPSEGPEAPRGPTEPNAARRNAAGRPKPQGPGAPARQDRPAPALPSALKLTPTRTSRHIPAAAEGLCHLRTGAAPPESAGPL